MGILKRLVVGLSLARGSIDVLRDHPHLLWFPFVGGLAGIAFFVTLMGSVVFFTDVEGSPVLYAALFLAYVGETFLAAFFTAALMYSTRQAFRGEAPTVRAGLAAAWRHRWQLLAWAVVAAVVGVIIRAIEESSDLAGDVLAALFGVAWAVVTYFVVPVVIFEDTSIRGMFTRSGGLVKQVWGESLGAETGIGIVTFILVLAGLAVGGLAFLVLPTGTTLGLMTVIAIGGVAVIAAAVIGETLSGIAKTAVYVYATENESPQYFGHVDFGA